MGIKFSPCELLELAINIEKNGKDFYFGLVGITDNAQVETVFRQLAKEEEEHIEAFQNISADSCDFSAAEVYTDDYFSYLRAVSDQYIFTQKDKGKELAESVKSCEEALDVGIRVEKDSILFYSEMKEMMREDKQGVVDGIISAEKKHLEKLVKIKSMTK